MKACAPPDLRSPARRAPNWAGAVGVDGYIDVGVVTSYLTPPQRRVDRPSGCLASLKATRSPRAPLHCWRSEYSNTDPRPYVKSASKATH